ncbi:unnamed protein product [Diabrotica balteata]|uniref:Uncharacterized protein n=1 Tax=Diabrotica balteata TaxID=107213 RepID=A0A9N9SW06_DIABA|nr:unnamed protein product [Diabrotica balteata]
MLSLYRTLIRSKLDYGAIAYSSATESSLKILDSIHNTALRIVLGAYRTTPIESLYCEAAEPSLYHRRMYLKLTYAIKLNANPNNHTFKYDHLNRLSTFFSNKPRLHKPFHHRIKMDLSSLNITLPPCFPVSFEPAAPWTLGVPKIITTLTSLDKHTTNHSIIHQNLQNLTPNIIGQAHY